MLQKCNFKSVKRFFVIRSTKAYLTVEFLFLQLQREKCEFCIKKDWLCSLSDFFYSSNKDLSYKNF